MIKRDVSGSVWDWQSGVKTLPNGAKVPLSGDSSFRVWFEGQLVGGQELPHPKDYFKVTLLKTGPAGYIKFHLPTAKNVTLVDAQGDTVHFVLHGHVELTWEEKDD